MIFTKTMIVSFGGWMILTPMGLLYLVSLSKAASFGIVVGFTVIFILAMEFVVEAKAEAMLLGLCAYTAVLGTLMKQLGDNTYN